MTSVSVKRFDRSELRKAEKTREGFLHADAFLSRIGLQTYVRSDGKKQVEYRPAEEVFHPDSLKSFTGKPLTKEHPKSFVTTDNWRSLAMGHLSEQAAAHDETYVRAQMVVTDADAISDLESGKRREVSCGYTCDLDETPGEFEGQKYDAIQRNIRINHIALVTKGRAGPEVRARMDGDDAIEDGLTPVSTTDAAPGRVPEEKPMAKHRIDGVDHEVPELTKQALEHADKARADAAAKSAAELKAAQDEAAKHKGRADQLEKEHAELKKKHEDASDPAKLDALVKARTALVTKASSILGADAKLDGLAEREVHVAVLTKLDKDFKADGMDDAYLRGRFDGAVAVQATKPAVRADAPRRIQGARAAAVMGRKTEDADPVEAAMARFQARSASAWKKDSSAEAETAEDLA